MLLKGRKGEKEIEHSKLLGSRVQRRENVGGSLNPWIPLPSGLTPLTNRNVIHKTQFVKYFCQKNFLVPVFCVPKKNLFIKNTQKSICS